MPRMNQYSEGLAPSLVVDINNDPDFVAREISPTFGWTPGGETGTTITRGLGSPLGSYLAAPDVPWEFGAEYAVDTEASYVSSELPPSSRSWPNDIPSHLSMSVSLGYEFPVAESMEENMLSHDGEAMEGSNISGRSGPQSTNFSPTSSGEDLTYTTQGLDMERTGSQDASSRKRPHDEFMTCFPSGSQNTQVVRTKRPYQQPRKEEVALNRDVGSCSRCRFRHVPFKFPRPCDKCIEAAAGSQKLARWICVRDSFHQLRFGGFDLLFESFTDAFLKSEIQKYDGDQREIHLALKFVSETPSPTNSFSIPVIVRNYSNQVSETETLYHTIAIERTKFENIPSDRYAIIPRGVPSLDDLLKCAQAAMSSSGGAPVQRLITALEEFMDLYCENKPQLPLNDLLISCGKVLKLLRCWRSTRMVVSGTYKQHYILAPKAVSSQILQVIKEGFRNQEMYVLKQLEKHIYGAKGPGQENMIPLWACLWSLILTYRDCMEVYKQYSLAPRPNDKQVGCSDHEMGTDASKQMYKKLTVNYSALFHTSTPLHIDWQVGDNFNFIGKSKVLKEAFLKLRDQFLELYNTRDELGVEDSLLKEFIIDQENVQKPGHSLKV